MSQLLDHPSIVNGDITGYTPLSWNAANEALPMNSDLRALPSPSTSSSSATSGYSSGSRCFSLTQSMNVNIPVARTVHFGHCTSNYENVHLFECLYLKKKA